MIHRRGGKGLIPRALPAALALAAGCATQVTPIKPAPASAPHVEQLAFTMSNAFVVVGQKTILIDAGTAAAGDDVVEALQRFGVRQGDLSLIVLTHGHADHAGGAKHVRDRFGAPIAMGKGDAEMVRAGHNRPLRPMFFFARMLRPFVDRPFPAFRADLEVTERLDLRPYGIDGVVLSAPGHTPGTLVVELANGDAFVGDLMLGGYFGGAMMAHKPDTHYFHDDQRAAEATICQVLARGARRLFLGHGGPVAADAARDRFCKNR